MDLHFAEKCIIFVLAKRREPIDKGFSPLFLCENGRKNHCFTKHLEKFICRSGFSKCFCGNFSGQVGARIDDIGNRKVKIHLFSTLHFFHFTVTIRFQWKAGFLFCSDVFAPLAPYLFVFPATPPHEKRRHDSRESIAS